VDFIQERLNLTRVLLVYGTVYATLLNPFPPEIPQNAPSPRAFQPSRTPNGVGFLSALDNDPGKNQPHNRD